MTLAHFMADLRDDPADALEWDLRALSAADRLTHDRTRQYDASLTVNGMYPSLYASVAADYAGLGDVESARTYLARAEGVLPDLPEGAYRDHVRTEIDRLRTRLG